jgi:hypothetical protein
MKKNRRDEPTGVIIHIYMEMSQGNSLYLKQANMSFLSFPLHNWRTGGWNRSCRVGRGVVGTSGREEGRKGGRTVNMVQILHIHVHKCKNDTC